MVAPWLIGTLVGQYGYELPSWITAAGVLLHEFSDWRKKVGVKEVEDFREVMDRVSTRSRDVYHKLVYDDDALFQLFRMATPIDELANALEAGVRAYGGLDMPILNAGVFPAGTPIDRFRL